MGDLAFRDLEYFNGALLAKQCCQIFKAPDTLISRVLKSKYFVGCGFLDAKLDSNASFICGVFFGDVIYYSLAFVPVAIGFKLNVDAAFRNDVFAASLGVIVRDSCWRVSLSDTGCLECGGRRYGQEFGRSSRHSTGHGGGAIPFQD